MGRRNPSRLPSGRAGWSLRLNPQDCHRASDRWRATAHGWARFLERSPGIFLGEAGRLHSTIGLFSFGWAFAMTARPTILKFGGTSLEDAEAIACAARIVQAHRTALPVVVVSALSHFTDALLKSVEMAAAGDPASAARSLATQFERHLTIARALLGEERNSVEAGIQEARAELDVLLRLMSARPAIGARLQDEIVSYGERLSGALSTAALCSIGIPARYVDARRCIKTDEEHGRATPLLRDTEVHTRAELAPMLDSSQVPVLGGFFGSSKAGATTTLGRSGSDYTSALVGSALDAREIHIWTDVTGVLTADPRVVKTARTIPRLSYAEAAELAYFGAKVLHPKTIQPAVERQIPIRICNSRAPQEGGTLVWVESETTGNRVKGIAYKRDITVMQITSARMLGAYGFLKAIFEVFERHRTVVDIVTTSEVSVSVSIEDRRNLTAILRDLGSLGAVQVEEGRAIICVVGERLRYTPGIAAQVFNTIRDINVSLISQGASSVNLTFVIDEKYVEETLVRLHRIFFEEPAEESRAACVSH